jgi:hypothetical protein
MNSIEGIGQNCKVVAVAMMMNHRKTTTTAHTYTHSLATRQAKIIDAGHSPATQLLLQLLLA